VFFEQTFLVGDPKTAVGGADGTVAKADFFLAVCRCPDHVGANDQGYENKIAHRVVSVHDNSPWYRNLHSNAKGAPRKSRRLRVLSI
jgi:hypothetical protein